jgi:ketosteroid isomerase-like protein
LRKVSRELFGDVGHDANRDAQLAKDGSLHSRKLADAVAMTGDVGSHSHCTAKDPNGKPIDVTFRLTDIWRNTNGQWKLIHTHASFPVDMKTGKADMASKM